MHNSPGVIIHHDIKGGAEFARCHLVYKGKYVRPDCSQFELECEVYKVKENGHDVLSVHSICPKCGNAILIDSRNRKVWLEGGRLVPFANDWKLEGAKLFTERFECPWEMGGESDRHEFGIGLCRAAFEYTGTEVRDA